MLKIELQLCCNVIGCIAVRIKLCNVHQYPKHVFTLCTLIRLLIIDDNSMCCWVDVLCMLGQLPRCDRCYCQRSIKTNVPRSKRLLECTYMMLLIVSFNTPMAFH